MSTSFDPTSMPHWTRVSGQDIWGHDEAVDFMYRYWLDLCTRVDKPKRADIRPSDFPRHLPNIALLDVEPGDVFDMRVRLAGSEVSYYYGSITGGLMGDLKSKESSHRALSTCLKVVQTQEAWLNMTPSIDKDRQHLTLLTLYCPLFDDTGAVATILCTLIVSRRRHTMVFSRSPDA